MEFAAEVPRTPSRGRGAGAGAAGQAPRPAAWAALRLSTRLPAAFLTDGDRAPFQCTFCCLRVWKKYLSCFPNSLSQFPKPLS